MNTAVVTPLLANASWGSLVGTAPFRVSVNATASTALGGPLTYSWQYSRLANQWLSFNTTSKEFELNLTFSVFATLSVSRVRPGARQLLGVDGWLSLASLPAPRARLRGATHRECTCCRNHTDPTPRWIISTRLSQTEVHSGGISLQRQLIVVDEFGGMWTQNFSAETVGARMTWRVR